MLTCLYTPYVTTIVSASLSQGRLPDSQKHAIVLPLLKKSGLNSTGMTNLSSIEPVLSVKMIERVVTTRQQNGQWRRQLEWVVPQQRRTN